MCLGYVPDEPLRGCRVARYQSVRGKGIPKHSNLQGTLGMPMAALFSYIHRAIAIGQTHAPKEAKLCLQLAGQAGFCPQKTESALWR
jgi:hypothetical protein